MPDAVYLTQVSTAMQAAVREAQGLVDDGELGMPLAAVVRHARDLHDILAGELAAQAPAFADHSAGVLAAMDERLRTLERYLAAH